MFHYEKPSMTVLTDCAEGVYMASGASGCTASVGTAVTTAYYKHFPITIQHGDHGNASKTLVTFVFNQNVENLQIQVGGSVDSKSGNTVVASYGIGSSSVTHFINVVTGDTMVLSSIEITSISAKCS